MCRDITSSDDFRAYISDTPPHGRVLGYWCMTPSVAVAEILAMDTLALLLASGTLSPLPSWPMELRVPFDITLEGGHVISDEQLAAVVIPSGPSGGALNSSFRARSNDDFKKELGDLIANACRVIPEGVLVFFPSYGGVPHPRAGFSNPPLPPLQLWLRASICGHRAAASLRR
jgi:Rad3-related DNA helicase